MDPPAGSLEKTLGAASMEDLLVEWNRRLEEGRRDLEKEAAVVHAARASLAEKELQVKELEDRVCSIIGKDDVIDINAGGTVHSVARSTLCQAPGSALAVMFSGRWDEGMQRDSAGRPFLDVDPYCFEQILCFLRLKRIEGPEDPAPSPQVEATKRDAFNMFLRFYGLFEFVYPPNPKIFSSFSPPPSGPPREHLMPATEVRGYLLRFDDQFRLHSVYLGLIGDVEGCQAIIARGRHVLRVLPLRAKGCAEDPHVTHVAEDFDLVLQPPECSIMVRGNGSAQIKYQAVHFSDRTVGPFVINSKCMLPPDDSDPQRFPPVPPDNNSYQLYMVVETLDT